MKPRLATVISPVRHRPVSPAAHALRVGPQTSIAPQRGFTIVELLIVLAIGGILATIAVPSMRDMLRTTRQSSALSLLVTDLNHARGEAIKRNTRTLICKRNVLGTDCDPTALTATDWRAGWVVCTDADGNNACDPTSAVDPNPFVVRPPLDASLTLAAAGAFIRFNANSSQGPGGTVEDLVLSGNWTGAASRTVRIAPAGNITKP